MNWIKRFIFNNFAVSAGVSLITSIIMSSWRRNEQAVERSLPNFLDWFEARTGLDIPDDQENLAVSGWLKLVHGADLVMRSTSAVRMLVKYLRNTNNEGQKDALIAEANKLGFFDMLTENFSAGIKAEVNAMKHIEVTRVAASILPNMTKREVDANIKKACKINSPILHAGEEITPELLAKLGEESRARKEDYKK